MVNSAPLFFIEISKVLLAYNVLFQYSLSNLPIEHCAESCKPNCLDSLYSWSSFCQLIDLNNTCSYRFICTCICCLQAINKIRGSKVCYLVVANSATIVFFEISEVLLAYNILFFESSLSNLHMQHCTESCKLNCLNSLHSWLSFHVAFIDQ